jgi:hypothetical protein
MRPDRRKKGNRSPKVLLLAFVAFAIALLLLRMWVFVHGKR